MTRIDEVLSGMMPWGKWRIDQLGHFGAGARFLSVGAAPFARDSGAPRSRSQGRLVYGAASHPERDEAGGDEDGK